jgi:hypothetical protein
MNSSLFMTHSGRAVDGRIHAVSARSVAGFGVDGPLGPRPGNSSGVLPGSSSGRGGSPGSRIGGGISGCGLPGGSSRGGSVGVPGVGGGISGGSIGIADHVSMWTATTVPIM